MTNNTQNQFIVGGLNFDKHYALSEGEFYYLRNGDISDYTNSSQNTFAQNVPSNELCVELPGNGKLKGHIKLDKDQLIIFSQTTADNFIYLLDNKTCQLTELVSGGCLNFQNYVTGVYKYKGCDRIIYFTDGINPLRYLNLSDIPRVNLSNCADCDQKYGTELDCEKLRIYKCAIPPNIEIDVTEGNIPDGVYQIGISFGEEDEQFTEIFVYSDVFNLHGVHNQNGRFGFRLNIECQDTVYDQFKIYLIANRDDRGQVAQEIGTFEKSTQVLITELDSPKYNPISNEELLLTKTYYQTAENVATNGDHLVFSELTERQDFNYQFLANQIKSFVDVIKVPSKQAHKYPSYMTDEVYPFYIQWLYCDGQATTWTHIPSDAPFKTSYNDVVTNSDVWEDPCKTEIKKYWEVYNTAELISVREENDNGFQPTNSETPDPDCKTYKITTQQNGWPGTLIYKSCDWVNGDSFVEEYGYPHELTFCTKDIASATFVFDPFVNQDDILITGDCINLATDPLTCKAFQFTKFDTSVVTTSTVSWDACVAYAPFTNPADLLNPLWTEDCNIASVVTGNVATFTGCACNVSNSGIITFDITLSTPTFVFEQDGLCGELTNNPGSSDADQCDYSVVATSTFAYWESSLKYPKDNFSNLPNYVECETGIRYHKFPDRTATLNGKHFPHIHNNTLYANGKEYVYILAPRFENILPPVDCDGKTISDIVGFRIGVGDRSNNKSIVHKGLIYNMREETTEDCEIRYFPNYPFNDLNPDQFIGDTELLHAKGGVLTKGHTGKFTPMKNYSKDKFQYISPDIQYEKSDNQGTELYTYCEENGYLDGTYQYTDEIPQVVLLEERMYFVMGLAVTAAIAFELIPLVAGGADAFSFLAKIPETLRKFMDGKNYALNGTFYSNLLKRNWTNITNGNRRRKIDTSFYMQPVKQQLDGLKINNYQRESGLFLDLNNDLTDPFIKDKSRILWGDKKTKAFSSINQSTVRTSQYYVGIKRRLESQYGNINDPLVKPITNILTGRKTTSLITGDIYITKHTTTKKFPFFTNLPLNAPYDSSFVTSSYLNVGFPKFWMDNIDRNDIRDIILAVTRLKSILGALKLSKLNRWFENAGTIQKGSCKKKASDKKRFGVVDGHFYTHLIGVLNYYCESEYIGDYRETNEVPQSIYYPLKDVSDFSKYETIQYPEIFKYSQQQRFKGLISKYAPETIECEVNCFAKNRVIFSQKQDTFSKADRWLNFPALNYHQFNQQDGDLTDSFSIDDNNILFLFDNAAYVSQNDQGLLSTNGTVYLGQGSIFERRLKKISSEVNGLGGSIDKFGTVNTPFGVFWPDRNRKTFVGYSGSGLTEISTNMKSWFNEFMDTPIHGHYDPFSRNIYWTSDRWTLSFKPELKQFVSFHDFMPSRYLPMDYNYLSYKEQAHGNSIWKHNKKNHYQTYYQQTFPFEIGYTINNKFKSSVLQSLEVQAEFYKNEGFGKKNYTGQFFDKFFLYNDRNSTGLEKLYLKNPSAPLDHLIQPQFVGEIEVTNTEYDIYRINGFQNFATPGNHIFWNSDGFTYQTLNQTESIVNSNNGTIRGKWFNTHLISTASPEVKKTVQISVNLQDKIN